MACEVASSPFSEHALDETWMKTTENGNGFDALVEFNATYGGTGGHNTIDPQMLSNPPSPANSFTSDFNMSGMEQTNHGLGIYPHDFASTQAPYYSIEQQQHAGSPSVFTSSSIRHEFRRSVSEPPGELPLHQQHHVQNFGPQMTFNRNGHFIGNIQPPQLQRLKSLPKAKPSRSQPYKTKTNGQQQQQRYQLRRSQTQPVRQHAAPTSTPTMMAPPPSSHPYPAAFAQGMSPGGHMAGQQIFEPLLPAVPEQRSYISSRVCTPTPEDVFGGSPVQRAIDPMCTAPPTPGVGRGGGGADGGVTVAMSVDQLKSMITEAVQKAVMGLGSRSGDAGPATEGAVLEGVAETAVMSIEGQQASGGLTEGRQREDVSGGPSSVMKVEHPAPQDAKHDDLDGLFVA
ncbi:hypothetical protein B0A55_02452 [Friedmanniomyces simplex]|uniref:Uncharacterized protein n=1 Tax=Friedmanniomyces simplex TaxID=329884 RepID=A0A4U0XWJ4_9PEZI|nr:hypothetical protein B0A55_02452 [Friedmanniomyces simplex]